MELAVRGGGFGREGLMPRGAEAYQRDRDGGVRGMDHPDKRQRAERRDKQGRLALTVDAPAAPDQVRRQPAARNRADVGEQVDGDQRRTDRREETGVARREEFEPLRPRAEIGEPEQEKIPVGVGEEFGGDEIPGLALDRKSTRLNSSH